MDGFTLVLYVDGDNSVVEYWHQQFTDIEENGVCHLSTDGLNLNCLEPAEDGHFQFPLFSSEYWLKVAALHLIACQNMLYECLTL